MSHKLPFFDWRTLSLPFNADKPVLNAVERRGADRFIHGLDERSFEDLKIFSDKARRYVTDHNFLMIQLSESLHDNLIDALCWPYEATRPELGTRIKNIDKRVLLRAVELGDNGLRGVRMGYETMKPDLV